MQISKECHSSHSSAQQIAEPHIQDASSESTTTLKNVTTSQDVPQNIFLRGGQSNADPRDPSPNKSIDDLNETITTLQAENKQLKSSIKTGATNLLTALSVFSAGPWAVLTQPVFKMTINAAKKAITAYKSGDEKVGSAFFESMASDFYQIQDTFRNIKKDRLAFFASKENSAKFLGTVGSIMVGLTCAAILFSAAGPVGAAFGAGLGLYLGKAAGEALAGPLARYAESKATKTDDVSTPTDPVETDEAVNDAEHTPNASPGIDTSELYLEPNNNS